MTSDRLSFSIGASDKDKGCTAAPCCTRRTSYFQMISVICTRVWRMATKSWRDWPCRRLHCTRPDAEVLTFCRVRWNPRGVACRSRIWQVQLPRCYSRCPNDREVMAVTHVTELRSQSSPHRLAMPTQQLCCRSWARLEKSSLGMS